MRQLFHLPEEYEHIDDKGWNKNGTRPAHVSEEAWHLDAALFGNGFDHEVRCITDIRIRTHKHSTGRNSFQHDLGYCPDGSSNA